MSKIGQLTKVENRNSYNSASKEYYHLSFYDEEGNIQNLLLTEVEMKTVINRAKNNPEDIPEVTEIEIKVEGVVVKSVEYIDCDIVIEVDKT